MPMIDADGCLLNVSVEGRDGGPTLMLSNSLGSTMQMWEPQMKALTQVFRVIRYDRRGHGKSNVPPAPYTMERFGRDVLAVYDPMEALKEGAPSISEAPSAPTRRTDSARSCWPTPPAITRTRRAGTTASRR